MMKKSDNYPQITPQFDFNKLLRNPKADSQIKIIFKAPGVLIYQHPDKAASIFIRHTKTLRKPIVLFSIEGKQKTSRDLFQSQCYSFLTAGVVAEPPHNPSLKSQK